MTTIKPQIVWAGFLPSGDIDILDVAPGDVKDWAT